MKADQIEEIAVLTVRSEVAKYDILKPEIPTGDKTISWDGYITVFDNINRNKSSFKDRINVQIKGHLVKKLKEKGISKYKMEVSDLINYKKDGKGTLLLVVEIVDASKKKIYYANLLPVDLEEILQGVKGDQKFKTIDIKPVVEKTSSSLKNVCLNFINNSQRQMKSRIIKIDEIDKFKDINKYEFEVVIPSNEKLADYILNNEIYTYGYIGELPMAFPKGKVESFSIDIPNDIYIEGEKYYNKYNYVKNQKEEFFKIGKSIKFTKKQQKVSIKLSGNLYERIKDIRFLINFLKNKYFKINDNCINIQVCLENDKLKAQLEILEKELQELLKLKMCFEKFGIYFKTDFEEIKEKDWKNIDRLLSIYNNCQNLGITKTGIYYIDISKYRIYIFAIEETSGIINYYNYFSNDIFEIIEKISNDMKVSMTTPYILMKKENFLESSNMNIKVIENSIDKIPNVEKQIGKIRLLMLEILLAYDENKDESFLELANYINSIIIKKDKEEKEINTINKLQILFRKRKLEKNEIDELYQIRDCEKNNLTIQCAIAILLNNLMDFKRYFNNLSKEEQKQFMSYPIYNLLQEK